MQLLARAIATTVLAISGVFASLSLPASTVAHAALTSAPLCKAGQIDETFVRFKVAPTGLDSIKAWVNYLNTGSRKCDLPITYIGLEALSGTKVLEASAVPTNYIVGSVELGAGMSARAQVSAMRVSSFGTGCHAEEANRLIVLPLYIGWAKRSFRLAPSVLVCTGGDINIAGSDITKVPLPQVT